VIAGNIARATDNPASVSEYRLNPNSWRVIHMSGFVPIISFLPRELRNKLPVLKRQVEVGPERIQEGAKVYIYASTPQGKLWLAQPVSGSYCATATYNTSLRSPFRVTYGRGNPETVSGYSLEHDYFRLEVLEGTSYVRSCVYLYAATTGSAKYDVKEDNSKQWFHTDSKRNLELCYENESFIVDSYMLSYIAILANSDCGTYDLGKDKVWVESKYEKHLHQADKVYYWKFFFIKAN